MAGILRSHQPVGRGTQARLDASARACRGRAHPSCMAKRWAAARAVPPLCIRGADTLAALSGAHRYALESMLRLVHTPLCEGCAFTPVRSCPRRVRWQVVRQQLDEAIGLGWQPHAVARRAASRVQAAWRAHYELPRRTRRMHAAAVRASRGFDWRARAQHEWPAESLHAAATDAAAIAAAHASTNSGDGGSATASAVEGVEQNVRERAEKAAARARAIDVVIQLVERATKPQGQTAPARGFTDGESSGTAERSSTTAERSSTSAQGLPSERSAGPRMPVDAACKPHDTATRPVRMLSEQLQTPVTRAPGVSGLGASSLGASGGLPQPLEEPSAEISRDQPLEEPSAWLVPTSEGMGADGAAKASPAVASLEPTISAHAACSPASSLEPTISAHAVCSPASTAPLSTAVDSMAAPGARGDPRTSQPLPLPHRRRAASENLASEDGKWGAESGVGSAEDTAADYDSANGSANGSEPDWLAEAVRESDRTRRSWCHHIHTLTFTATVTVTWEP